MKPLKKLLKKLDGLHYKQEFLCLAKESLSEPLHVCLFSAGRTLKDITNDHLLSGYAPLIISISSHTNLPAEIELAFTQQAYEENEKFSEKDAIALLRLKRIRQQQAGNQQLFHFEGQWGSHHFTGPFHQQVQGVYNRLFNKKPGNIFLPGNLLKQVQIAYSVPRVISLVTLAEGSRFNLFPTDLHGPVGDGFYLDSLRENGKACEQVMRTGKMLITELDPSFYKTVYSLGRNHMQEMKGKEEFPFGPLLSKEFALPIPPSAILYRELELQDSFCHGIHRLMLFRTISTQVTGTPGSTLAHIHNLYASWRHKNDLPGNYLLR